MNSLLYRKSRIKEISQAWGGKILNDLMVVWDIGDEYKELTFAVKKYISMAMGFRFVEDEAEFIALVDECRNNRLNITPNGAVVPKSEYVLEYNFVIKIWCDIVRRIVAGNPGLLYLFRLTPNIRIKFGDEIEENIGRKLDTAIPHSDAWVEGPWGLNCHVPLLGDSDKNFLSFYSLKEEGLFTDDYLTVSKSYVDKQWVLRDYVEIDSYCTPKGVICLSDYALLHKTKRKIGAGTRISIDTTLMVHEHECHPERRDEYVNRIPNIGVDLFLQVAKSEKDSVEQNSSEFKHYTTGNINRIHI